MSLRDTWVRVNRNRASRSPAQARCSMAALGLLDLVWAVACDEGEATWSGGSEGSGEPVDVICPADKLEPGELWLQCSRHPTTTAEAVAEWHAELVAAGLLVLPGDGTARLPKLAKYMAKRFVDRHRKRSRDVAGGRATGRTTSREVSGGRGVVVAVQEQEQDRAVPDGTASALDSDGQPLADYLVAALHRSGVDQKARCTATSAKGFGQLYRRLVREGESAHRADQRIRAAIDGVFAQPEPDANGFSWADNLRSGQSWAAKTRAGGERRFERVERDLTRRRAKPQGGAIERALAKLPPELFTNGIQY